MIYKGDLKKYNQKSITEKDQKEECSSMKISREYYVKKYGQFDINNFNCWPGKIDGKYAEKCLQCFNRREGSIICN